MRSIMHIFKKKKDEAKRKKIIMNQNVSNTIKDLLNDDETEESFTLDKSLIIEAWSKYRPSSKENSPREGIQSPKKKDIQEIYGEQFLNRLLANIKQKKYRGKNDKINDDDKLKQHLTSLLVAGKQ